MVPYALKVLYVSKITCPLDNTTDIIKALASKYFSQFKSIPLPTVRTKVTPEQLKQMFLECINKANNPITEVLSYCANQVAKKAAEIDKEHAYTYARYLQNYAKRMKIVAAVLAPWIKQCGKVPPIEVPDLNQLFTAELVKLAGGTVYTVTKTVTTTTTVSLVTFIQGTTIIPVVGSPRISLTTTVFTNPFVRIVTETKTVTLYKERTTVSVATKTVTETKTVTPKPTEGLLKKVTSIEEQVKKGRRP